MKKFTIKNKWKALFFGLAIVNIGIVLWILGLVFLPTSYTLVNVDEQKENKEAQFTVVSTKENLEQLANEYLGELSKDTGLNYSISLERNVELKGNIEAFDQKIPLTAQFNPVVQENGDVVLEQESISLGKLPLPTKKVLEYVRDSYNLPEWVVVNPNDENIYVAVTDMETASNFNVSVDRFNLKSNQLAFNIAVPNESFNFAQRMVSEKLND
ncbi:YpmS family protein [Thalassobacillus sp. CUG 92003]|uniref:YpmS family protein n=1 Tax=Thalassobacillus sp. CUG 92003 TaxID=2736641 RepID=UPI0015E7D2EB|nr:YpmS family protein [Thalassobacillus sp. CUG 92003]